MIEVTRYLSNDGATFTTRADAEARDEIVVRVAEALALVPRPSPEQSEAMSGGKGYIQHPRGTVKAARARLLAIIAEKHPRWVKDMPRAFDPSLPYMDNILGRMLDGDGPLDRAWRQVATIDEQDREWEQLYFVINPNEAAVAI